MRNAIIFMSIVFGAVSVVIFVVDKIIICGSVVDVVNPILYVPRVLLADIALI